MKKNLNFLFILQNDHGQYDIPVDIPTMNVNFIMAAGAGFPQGFGFKTGYTFEVLSVSSENITIRVRFPRCF